MAVTDTADTSMMSFIEDLYPICRSITGDGVRQTLARIAEELPLQMSEVPSGTEVFDWVVPKEWNIREAYLENPEGRRVVDFKEHSLHVLNYSTAVDRLISLEELQEHLFSIPEQPDLIPYRTSYYSDNWGFCLTHKERLALKPGEYKAVIDAEHIDGSLTFGEMFIPGQSDEEVLVWSHLCHPSIANDNLSGLAVTTWWAKHLHAGPKPRYSYRFVWAPGTIGAITWLAVNQDKLASIRHGIVAVLLGRPGVFHLKQSRGGSEVIDRTAELVLAESRSGVRVRGFEPYGYDERQFCSPGIDLSLCRVSRAPNGEYPEYHTSGDNLSLISAEALVESLEVCKQIGEALEANRVYLNRLPMAEPQLGKRGLYHATGGVNPKERQTAMLWVLNQADGSKSLLDIAERSGMSMAMLATVAAELEEAGLLSEV